MLEWSRHFRCFPGQGTLDVAGVVAATLEAGLRRAAVARGVQRRGPRGRPGRHRARRDAVAGLPRGPARPSRRAPPGAGRRRRRRSSRSPGSPAVPPAARRARLRARRTAPHQAGHLVAQRRRRTSSSTTAPAPDPALGVVAAPVAGVAERAPRRCCGPRSTAPAAPARRCCRASPHPSGLHVFVSAAPARPTTGSGDFEPVDGAAPDGGLARHRPRRRRRTRPDASTRRSSFLRTLFGARARRRSRSSWSRTAGCAAGPSARRPAALRIVRQRRGVGAGAGARASPRSRSRCADVRAEVRALRGARRTPDAGAGQLLRRPRRPVRPGARRCSPTCASTACSTTGPATASCCTPSPRRSPTGFHVELLERRGGYDGYGSASTHVRLAMQRSG